MALGLVVTVPVSEAELASDMLWGLGVAAIEERSADEGFVELWTSIGDDHDTVVREAEAFPTRWRWRVVEIDPSVADAWREHAVVSWVERDLAIVPAWLSPELPDDVMRLDIDPGRHVRAGRPPDDRAQRPAAAQRPLARVPPSSTSAPAAACWRSWRPGSARPSCGPSTSRRRRSRVTNANAARNGVDGEIEVSNTPLAEVEEPADVVVANLLAPILIALAPELRRRDATGRHVDHQRHPRRRSRARPGGAASPARR